MNTMKTGILLAALTGLLMMIGGFFGGKQGVYIAFLLAAIMNFVSYWFSDKIVLKMYGAKEISERDRPDLISLVRNLALRANLRMPRVYIIQSDSPNAFATGRDEEHAVVAVTDSILRVLNRDELEGVLAHELTHIKDKDILVSSVAATLAGAVVMLANMAKWSAIFGFGGRDNEEERGGMIGLIVMAILAPIAAMIIQMAISRSREFMADEGGAHVSGKPLGLANALEKLSRASQVIPMDASPSTAHMFIVNPLTGRSLMNLFSTHPPVEERIARLRKMAR